MNVHGLLLDYLAVSQQLNGLLLSDPLIITRELCSLWPRSRPLVLRAIPYLMNRYHLTYRECVNRFFSSLSSYL